MHHYICIRKLKTKSICLEPNQIAKYMLSLYILHLVFSLLYACEMLLDYYSKQVILTSLYN